MPKRVDTNRVGLNPTEDRTKIYKKCQLILLTLLLLNGMLRRVRLYKKMLNTNWGSSEEDRGGIKPPCVDIVYICHHPNSNY